MLSFHSPPRLSFLAFLGCLFSERSKAGWDIEDGIEKFLPQEQMKRSAMKRKHLSSSRRSFSNLDGAVSTITLCKNSGLV